VTVPIAVCDGLGFGRRHDPDLVMHERNHVLRRLARRIGCWDFDRDSSRGLLRRRSRRHGRSRFLRHLSGGRRELDDGRFRGGPCFFGRDGGRGLLGRHGRCHGDSRFLRHLGGGRREFDDGCFRDGRCFFGRDSSRGRLGRGRRIMLILLALITLVATLFARETKDDPLIS
jgi:hypothetical protein